MENEAENQSEDEIVRAAAAAMGRRRTPAKARAAAENGKLGGRPIGSQHTAESKAKISEANKARWAERKQSQQEEQTNANDEG
jgi:DNA invertase Pin-like site-specific DNA recombinase